MKKLESRKQFDDIIKNDRVILLFSADWCPDCRFIAPALPEIEAENERFTFYYIDRDQFIDLCTELNVYGIPSFIAYHQGEEIGRFVNKDRKTKEQIQAFIDSLPA